jgi:membrane-associated protein
MHFDSQHLREWIQSIGYLGVWAIIFAESWIIFFLPGDSLLVTAGFVSYQGSLNLFILILGAFIGAVIGNLLGYTTGYRFGRRLFQKDSWLFKREYLVSTQNFAEKYGKKMIVLARFMPIIRTFAPILAGIGTMNYRIFVAYTVIGGIAWTGGLILLGYGLGYFLGKVVDVDKFLLPLIVLIIIASFIPSIIHFYQERKSKRH